MQSRGLRGCLSAAARAWGDSGHRNIHTGVTTAIQLSEYWITVFLLHQEMNPMCAAVVCRVDVLRKVLSLGFDINSKFVRAPIAILLCHCVIVSCFIVVSIVLLCLGFHCASTGGSNYFATRIVSLAQGAFDAWADAGDGAIDDERGPAKRESHGTGERIRQGLCGK